MSKGPPPIPAFFIGVVCELWFCGTRGYLRQLRQFLVWRVCGNRLIGIFDGPVVVGTERGLVVRPQTTLGPYDYWAIEYAYRSEEHTSELQSRLHLVCPL